jgi:hypothetical protein
MLTPQRSEHTLAEDQQTTLRTPTGVADFYQTGPFGPELIEAKSSGKLPTTYAAPIALATEFALRESR